MGLPMDDIHTPTVASGPTSARASYSTKGDREVSLLDLITEKTQLEEELKALSGVLDSVRMLVLSHSSIPAERCLYPAAWS